MGVLTSDPLLALFVVVALGAASVGCGYVGSVSDPPQRCSPVSRSPRSNRTWQTFRRSSRCSGWRCSSTPSASRRDPRSSAGSARTGFKVSVAVIVLLAAIGLTVAGVSALFDFDDGARAGLFAGSQTNTPALSAALEQLAPQIESGEVTDPVVGYSLAYPLGVLSMIVAAGLSIRRLQHPSRRDARTTTDTGPVAQRDQRDRDRQPLDLPDARRTAHVGGRTAGVLARRARRRRRPRHERRAPRAR
jgi:hypothetical protein